ncbi:glycogen debranching protein GlgX [Brachybacterium sp. MASK1Z-5]|uniref:Glycogen debranching protein GlgX n=1 Tax=Brachybacterium halotolerans TaxID=2795215 RepID=A0ABS1B6S7_9MICO|nr:glycogen debranching protein GlgX [Brachybacterium halotolerans]MBK0330347.1 glycogen debranching protein GlgX [Brachybacterium halotolerans]
MPHPPLTGPGGPGADRARRRAPSPPTRPGLHVDAGGHGTFAVVAPRAERVELCVRRDLGGGRFREERTTLRHVDGGLHWDEVEAMVPGTLYGLRAHGPWDPERGAWFNPAKLLLDPRARAVSHASPLASGMFPHEVDAMLDPISPLRRSESDDADVAVWSVVAGSPEQRAADGPRPSAGSDPSADSDPSAAPPRTPWSDTVVCELHVKGFTQLHPDVPPELRGTYAGLAHPAVTSYLSGLGVTAVELLPIHAAMDEPHLTRRGLTNYWGYSTLSYLAPNPAYASAAARLQGPLAVLEEVRAMVRALHAADLEVILDVVFNHTAEGGFGGPSLSLRGLDASEHYWMDGGAFVDVTGTGATLDPRSPAVVDLVLESLRHWVLDMGVDGFRFDLAATLGRDSSGFRPDHALLRAITLDPVLRGTKLIAEPWDVGGGGWQTGAFPAPFAEWNDAFRDDLRSFWLTDRAAREREGEAGGSGVRDLASRLAGSRDVMAGRDPADLPAGRSLRAPWASVNFVTAHDGFTLQDLVSYDERHNEANGEAGRDGTADNRSWNHGHEGPPPADDPGAAALEARRERSARALLASLLLAAGTPMLTAGDEFGRTQRGNNNAYCQDNEISWVDWSLVAQRPGRIEAVRALLAIRARFPQLRAARYLRPLDPRRPGPGQAGWYDEHGEGMDHEPWQDPSRHVLQMLLPGGTDDAGGTGGIDAGDGAHRADGTARADHLLVILSADEADLEVALPREPWLDGDVRVLFDSAVEDPAALFAGGEKGRVREGRTHVRGASVLVLAIAGYGHPDERLS